MSHDIIDNRREKLVDHINRVLSSTESARFAVGYFFLSGLESIAEKLAGVKDLRLLIGNTTNQETVEQLAEGYRRLELVADSLESQTYPKRTEAKRIAEETSENLRSSLELMDQTDEDEALVGTLARMIEEKRLKVRLYTKGGSTLRPISSTTPHSSIRRAGPSNATRTGSRSSAPRT